MVRYHLPILGYADLAIFLCTFILIFQGAAVCHDNIRDELIAVNIEGGV